MVERLLQGKATRNASPNTVPAAGSANTTSTPQRRQCTPAVTPAQAGVHGVAAAARLDSRLRGNDIKNGGVVAQQRLRR